MLAPLADIVALYDTDEDLTVQVRIDGVWHRKAIGGRSTACGQLIHYRHVEPRKESYLGHLCTDGCFSDFELLQSRRENEKHWEDVT
jgi:hypothetical protein